MGSRARWGGQQGGSGFIIQIKIQRLKNGTEHEEEYFMANLTGGSSADRERSAINNKHGSEWALSTQYNETNVREDEGCRMKSTRSLYGRIGASKPR